MPVTYCMSSWCMFDCTSAACFVLYGNTVLYITYCDSVRYASRMSRWREATIPHELRVLYTSRARTSLQAVNEVLLNDNVICHQKTWAASLPMPPPRFCPCHTEVDPGRCTYRLPPRDGVSPFFIHPCQQPSLGHSWRRLFQANQNMPPVRVRARH